MRATEPAVAVIIPVCNEEECLGEVLRDLRGFTGALEGGGVIAVGLNATTDASAAIAREAGALVGEVETRGYGHGCLAAIEAVRAAGISPGSYLFAAGDGANAAEDLEQLWKAYTAGPSGCDMALAERTWGGSGEHPRSLSRTLPNLVLGLWASLLGGRLFLDLGPLRVIRRELFEAMELEEAVWGWTIEAQVVAVRLGARLRRVPIPERVRIAGEQKVSGTGLRSSLRIGLAIAQAGWRARRRR